MSAYTNNYIPVNKYTRPGLKLNGVKKLVVHYTANPGASADNHRRYFSNAQVYASAHIFVDKTEAICIIPLNEVAYHANDIQQRDSAGNPYRGVAALKPNANFLSIGVEMCLEKDGSFHSDTVERTEDVFVELCKKFGLDPIDDIVRHYDITHKNCPEPWVSNSQKFVDFKNRVKAKMSGESVSKASPTKPTTSSSSSSSAASGSLKSKVDSLRFYSKPSWEDKDVVGTVNKGIGFPTVVEKVKVGSAYQYKVKNSKGATYYITASDKYVDVTGSVKTSSSAPKTTSTSSSHSSIKSVGKIKIVGVSSAAIVMDKPDRNSSKNIGTVKLGSTISISGSVKGKNNSKGYWEVIYKGKRGYISGQFGSKI
ncbi:N-acetylmuramoyl-L-alanine amidase BlyA [Bacillus halotolerans]|uniref:N-acetylmuramoyl-L-alanine amidase BlyA n=1 Tax=Bacillus halotolerans TaxID=260554 RepID=UPI001C0EE7D3|nr:N-acetylmuramoyl-L-alanine amidase BlyA [Bacillus halotolerans]MBU5245198.1 N-acetylmuramoyl-L-alanine amidase BlyA [Bacillus halotolerans]